MSNGLFFTSGDEINQENRSMEEFVFKKITVAPSHSLFPFHKIISRRTTSCLVYV